MKQNPKHIRAMKDGKIPLEFLIPGVLEQEAWVLAHGAGKYGVRNWRKDRILASTYEGAMLRHVFEWMKGNDIDPESGKPHLAHLRACTTVVLDAQARKTFIDDRNRMESINDQSVQREKGRRNRRRRVYRKRAVISDP